MDNSIQEVINDYDRKPRTITNKQKVFENQNEMASVLRDEVELWQLEHQSEKQAKANIKPKLPPLAGARIMFRHFDFCLFSNDEDKRMAVYLPDDGIYTQNYRYLKRLIAIMYPSYNFRQALDVIYHIEMMAPVRSLTIDRYLVPVNNGIWNLHQHKLMPFSPQYVFTTKIATNYHDKPAPPSIKGWTVDKWLSELACGDDIAPDVFINDSSNFNSVVTGDLVNIEFKRKDSYTARLMPTVIQSCNGLPNFHNKGGTMRRIVIVPFNNHFSGNGDNWNVRNDYITRNSILEYVLYRALQLDFEKFDIPNQSQQALDEFELDNDPLLGFKTTLFDQLEIVKIPTYYLYELW